MDILFNDLSIHGQFHDIKTFRESINRIMNIRASASEQFGQEIYCGKKLRHVKVTSSMYIEQALSQMRPDLRVALKTWLLKKGPFWEDRTHRHDGNEFWIYEKDTVEETALAEAAFRNENGKDCQLLSVEPSNCQHTPLIVCKNDNSNRIEVPNHTKWETLEGALQKASKPIKNWSEFEEFCRRRYANTKLSFSDDAFQPLDGIPFRSMKSFFYLLDALESLKCEMNEKGERTKKGHQIYEEFFKGEEPYFKDSSISEKNNEKFREKLTFPHPERPGEMIECFWHGKIPSQFLRFHFSWPINATTPLYIVYIGPKLTKQ